MNFVDALEAMAFHRLSEKPKVGEFGKERTWVLDDRSVGDVWYQVEENNGTDDGDDNVGG